jgi:hypothetical protein
VSFVQEAFEGTLGAIREQLRKASLEQAQARHEQINSQLVAHYTSAFHAALVRLFPGARALALRGEPILSPEPFALSQLVALLQQLYADAYLGGLRHASEHLSERVEFPQEVKRWLPTHTIETVYVNGPGLFLLTAGARGIAEGIAETFYNRLLMAVERGKDSGWTQDRVDREVRVVLHSESQAKSVVATESARAQVAALEDSFEDGGISEFHWAPDEHPCPECAEMANSGPHSLGSKVPPLHPNDRCTIVPVMNSNRGQQ